LAAEIKQRYPGAEIELHPSPGGGRFEVLHDGTPIFEKSKLGRHAKPGEIMALLAGADRT
jgi:selT/selW/selH-like putative selenoprotein